RAAERRGGPRPRRPPRPRRRWRPRRRFWRSGSPRRRPVRGRRGAPRATGSSHRRSPGIPPRRPLKRTPEYLVAAPPPLTEHPRGETALAAAFSAYRDFPLFWESRNCLTRWGSTALSARSRLVVVSPRLRPVPGSSRRISASLLGLFPSFSRTRSPSRRSPVSRILRRHPHSTPGPFGKPALRRAGGPATTSPLGPHRDPGGDSFPPRWKNGPNRHSEVAARTTFEFPPVRVRHR